MLANVELIDDEDEDDEEDEDEDDEEDDGELEDEEAEAAAAAAGRPAVSTLCLSMDRRTLVNVQPAFKSAAHCSMYSRFY